MLKHNDRDVLETCSKTLEYLCTEGSAIFTQCNTARSLIIDACVLRYQDAIDAWRGIIAREDIPNADAIFSINVSLKKVSILYSCHNLNNPWELLESLFEDLEIDIRTGEGQTLPTEVCSCLSTQK